MAEFLIGFSLVRMFRSLMLEVLPAHAFLLFNRADCETRSAVLPYLKIKVAVAAAVLD